MRRSRKWFPGGVAEFPESGIREVLSPAGRGRVGRRWECRLIRHVP
jgi:hypothetical protein